MVSKVTKKYRQAEARKVLLETEPAVLWQMLIESGRKSVFHVCLRIVRENEKVMKYGKLHCLVQYKIHNLKHSL